MMYVCMLQKREICVQNKEYSHEDMIFQIDELPIEYYTTPKWHHYKSSNQL